jgi:serine/threonine-protein kinase RsbW
VPAAAQREVLTAASPASAGSNTLRVPWRPTSVGRVRRALVQDLKSRGVPPTTIDESEIVVSELLSNAIRHASPLSDGTLRVHWKVKAGVVEVEVTDGGGETTPRPAPRQHGVGLARRAVAPPQPLTPPTPQPLTPPSAHAH